MSNPHYDRGLALHQANRLAEALAAYDLALVAGPGHAEALCKRGALLWALERFDEALASTEMAVAARPHYVEAIFNRGVMLQQMRRPEAALASYDAALVLQPKFLAAIYNRAGALQALGRPLEALQATDAALALAPRQARLYYHRGTLLRGLGRHAEAIAAFDATLAIDPAHRAAPGDRAAAAMHLCDWKRVAALIEDVKENVVVGTALVPPLAFLGLCDDPLLQLRCARNCVTGQMPAPHKPWDRAAYNHDKIRIGYLSADFRDHAVAAQIVELVERHDRSRFEITGVSFAKDDGSATRQRLVRAFDAFHDMSGESDEGAARRLRTLEIDIAVDLGGHTANSRTEVLSWRPAPVQVSYLGYPGTTGADFIDYILADAIVAAEAQWFSEKCVHLPDTFWISNSTRLIAPAPTRGEAGLPQEGFVFCCFNNAWKITAPVFDVWMRLLGQVPGSVLWLREPGKETRDRLGVEAAARDIEPGRLVFAPRANDAALHLARYRAADLFLDTLPYNAHATASDALWAGLPLVTCEGRAFAGRVATSLVKAAGLPELSTASLGDYEALALALARDPARLKRLGKKLASRAAPLFDTALLTRQIEAAFVTMHAIAARGEKPHAFRVEHGA